VKREKREEKSACKQTNEANEAKAKRDGNLVAKKRKRFTRDPVALLGRVGGKEDSQ